MKGLLAAVLVVLACMLACSEANSGGNRRGYNGNNAGRHPGGYSQGNRQGNTDRSRGGGHGYGHGRSNPHGGNYSAERNGYCGGEKQSCCQTAQPCQGGMECKLVGERSWVSAKGRCVRPWKTHRCGGEGMDCCRGRGSRLCQHGLECAADMCRNPTAAVNLGPPEGALGQTTVAASGWLMVMVRAHGGKCFVRVRGSLTTNVESYGEGTFGEVFGDLSGMGECEEGAQGAAVGYIRVEVMSTATLTEDGDCIADGTSDIAVETRVRGEGITLGIGGGAGANVGCHTGRRLRVLSYIPL